MSFLFKPLPAWALACCVVFSFGCGGGAGTEPGPEPDDPVVPLALDAQQIPDDVLRHCINQLAQENNWAEAEQVSTVQCPSAEVLSIEGLQMFPNLSELKINAPRFNLDEIPLLVSLPLADFQRKPIYNSGVEEPGNVVVGIKQILAYDSIVLTENQLVTYVFLTANDPAFQDDELVWSIDVEFFQYPPFLDIEVSTGMQQINANVALHWIQYDKTKLDLILEQAFVTGGTSSPYLHMIGVGENSDSFSMGRALLEPEMIPADRLIADLVLGDEINSCVQQAITLNGWETTWQVLELDCSGFNISDSDLFELTNFPKLEHLILNGTELTNLYSLRLLPYLQTLSAPGFVTTEDLLADYPWTFSPEPTFYPEKPRLSVQSCGLKIDNFDETANYELLGKDRGELLQENSFSVDAISVVWQGDVSPNCMPLVGDLAWQVRIEKDGLVIASDTIPVSDNEGNILQMIYQSTDLPSITVPATLDQFFYVSSNVDSGVRIAQYDLYSWSRVREVETENIPVYADASGVYLFKNPHNRYSDRSGAWIMSASGEISSVAQPPVVATPLSAIEHQGEIWFYGLQDDWGYRPEILIWNQTTQVWRTLEADNARVRLVVVNGQICNQKLKYEYSCLAEDGQTWELYEPLTPIYGAGSQRDFGASTEYWFDETGIAQLLAHVTDWADIPHLASSVYARDFVGFNAVMTEFVYPNLLMSYSKVPSLVDYRNPVQPQYYGPILPTLPWRSNYKVDGDDLYVLFNDSVAKYPLD